MVPDVVDLVDSLPKTSTGKTDRALLARNLVKTAPAGTP